MILGDRIMDQGTLTTVITTATGLIGGMYSGVKYGKQSALAGAADSSTIATNTVEMLQAQVNHLEEVVQEKNQALTEVTARVSLLEDLVTQRAAVSEVYDEVKSTRLVVDRIAEKVGA